MPFDYPQIPEGNFLRYPRPGTAPPPDEPGLVIPGANRPYQPPPRERGLNEMIGGLGGMALEASDLVPRYAAWNLGPMLVGRNGQGPLNGADALRGAGILQGSHGQRAIAAGLGAGLDLTAQPLNLLGMGAGRAAANPLTARLERMTGSLPLERQVTQARIDNWIRGVGHPGLPEFAPGAGGPLANAGALPRPPAALADTVPGGGAVAVPGRTGRASPGMRGYVDPASYGYDADALRSFQLNHPSFNPAEPAFGLGTGQFTQDAGTAARYGLGEYNPLTTAGSQPAASANPLTAQLQQMAGGTPASRFDRMIPARPLPQIPSQAAAEASANLAARLRGGPQAPQQLGADPFFGSRGRWQTQPLGEARGYVDRPMPDVPVGPRSMDDLSARTLTTPEISIRRPPSNAPPSRSLEEVMRDLEALPRGGVSPRAVTIPPNRQGTLADVLSNSGPGRSGTIGPRSQTILQPPPDLPGLIESSGRPPYQPSMTPPVAPPPNYTFPAPPVTGPMPTANAEILRQIEATAGRAQTQPSFLTETQRGRNATWLDQNLPPRFPRSPTLPNGPIDY